MFFIQQVLVASFPVRFPRDLRLLVAEHLRGEHRRDDDVVRGLVRLLHRGEGDGGHGQRRAVASGVKVTVP